ncbi:efflux RND transporter periplasmic adaptor subunit [Aureivirga sp. CE67]|uniref:efflux RND transporter periplasmic adaptor subunit n=1 Tax=Aureivirga sp. CE67 TaxID=1788983 RepID=UPI0018CAD91F|nr:efflux RND transporter periplasmic adaptor subunit [Aureivirga sp. CE67]
MKKIYSVVLLTALLASCGSKDGEKTVDEVIKSKDLKEINAKKDAIMKKYDALYTDIAKLEEAVAKLDTVKQHPIVTSYQIKSQEFKHYVDIQGDVQTKENIVIYPETSGILRQVLVSEGQKVVKGQTLAIVDDGGLSQQLAQLEVQTALAKTTFERQEKLWNQKIGSEIQYLQAKSNYEAQQKAIEQIKIQLAKNTIKAPISGIVDDVITEQGNVVAPGQSQLIRIINLDNMYAKAEVPETYLSKIKKGTEVIVSFPSLGKEVPAKIRLVGNYINPNNRTFTVEVALPNNDHMIKPNLIASLKINDYTNENAIIIPDNIIQENANGEKYIFVLKDKNAKNEANLEKRKIKTGENYNDFIEVIEGVANNEAVVEEGAKSMREGLTVKVK